jgi:hypothetical protein
MNALFLGWSIAISMFAPLLQGAPSDVPTGHWAYRAVDELFKAGILHGYPDQRLEGDRSVTRAEMAAAIAGLKKAGG